MSNFVQKKYYYKCFRCKNKQVGFQNLFTTEVRTDSAFPACLDKWNVQKTKNGNKNKFEKKMEPETIGRVQSLFKGLAILMPTENDNKEGWSAISDDELEEEIIEKEKQPVINGNIKLLHIAFCNFFLF